jgi:hypothetical protein
MQSFKCTFAMPKSLGNRSRTGQYDSQIELRYVFLALQTCLKSDKRLKTFHTDTFCDILALQTRSNAARGGKHIISSSWTIYNKIAAERPDLLEALAAPNWPFDRLVFLAFFVLWRADV